MAFFSCEGKSVLFIGLNNSASFLTTPFRNVDHSEPLDDSIQHAIHPKGWIIIKKQSQNTWLYLNILIILCSCYCRICSYGSHSDVRITDWRFSPQRVIVNMGGILFNLKTNGKRRTLLTEHCIIGDNTFWSSPNPSQGRVVCRATARTSASLENVHIRNQSACKTSRFFWAQNTVGLRKSRGLLSIQNKYFSRSGPDWEHFTCRINFKLFARMNLDLNWLQITTITPGLTSTLLINCNTHFVVAMMKASLIFHKCGNCPGTRAHSVHSSTP